MGGHISQPLKAVAFDLDGTLYPNYLLYIRLLPKLALHPFFYSAFSKARNTLHYPTGNYPPGGYAEEGSFYDKQAEAVAKLLGKPGGQIKQKLEERVYTSWEKHFSGIRLFPQLKETLCELRRSGLRLGILSDFPPAKKLSLLGLNGFFDTALSSEETGALKPSGIPFAALARALDAQPGEILYVGNNVQYDIEGAKAAGMETALIKRNSFSTGYVTKHSAGSAGFVFRGYRQLQEYILQYNRRG